MTVARITKATKWGTDPGQTCPYCHCLQPASEEPQLYSVYELLDWPMMPTGVSLLLEAAHAAARGYEGACWRAADALLELGTKFPEAAGVASPTGRGAMLRKVARK